MGPSPGNLLLMEQLPAPTVPPGGAQNPYEARQPPLPSRGGSEAQGAGANQLPDTCPSGKGRGHGGAAAATVELRIEGNSRAQVPRAAASPAASAAVGPVLAGSADAPVGHQA